jgi:glycosyltransferase involved in cell wall biosynthesis
MKIDVLLLDQLAKRQSHGGVVRYIRHMIAALNERFSDRFAVCSDLLHLPADTYRVHLPDLRFRGMYHLGLDGVVSCAQGYLLNRLLKRIKPRLVFSPFFGLIAEGTPQVFTVYDFALELYPHYFAKRFLPMQLAQMRECYRHASALFCISESTRNDLLRLYPFVNPERVHVTHLGVDESFFSGSKDTANETPYFLFVGDRGRTKNFARSLEAFALSGLARNYMFRVVTPRPAHVGKWTQIESDFIRTHNLESRIKLETSVPDDRLRMLYRNADFFIYPSEYEGFGLPILEAMASGTIVLCSSTSSLPEVAGDAAVYFDPYDVWSIGNALQRAATLSSDDRNTMIEKGFARARLFTWSSCADKTISVLKNLLVSQQ